MQCNVRLLGHLFPVMIWRREGQLVDGVETETIEVRNGIVIKSSFLVQVTSMDNGVTFSCETLFIPNVYTNSFSEFLIKATNAPDYKHTWTSHPISVSCKVESMI